MAKIQNDQFYTKASVAKSLIEKAKSYEWFGSANRIIEPSAGTGAFSSQLKCIAYDIDPKHPDISAADFLSLPLEYAPGTLVIGNPPFGDSGSLALAFMKKSMEIADYVAFILPRSFRKKSIQNKVPLTHSLLFEEVLKDDVYILPDGAEHSVKTVFQIWEKKSRKKHSLKPDEKFFTFVKKHEDADFWVRRVGWYAGRLSHISEQKSPSSHYIIRANSASISTAMERHWDQIDWEDVAEDSVGPRSISKLDITDKANPLLESILCNSKTDVIE